MVKNPKIAIIIVYYSGIDDLKDCLESLKKQSLKDFEVIVVNNSGKELKIKNFKLISNFKFQISNSPRNIGFAGGVNLGVKSATGKYIALLNPDIITDEKWLSELTRPLISDRNIGIAVGKIYRMNKKEKTIIIDSAGSLYNQIGSAWSRGYLEIDKGQFNKTEEVPMATAGACVFRREILEKTYLFDESFFMYMEEFDFCLRVRQLGYKIIYIPSAVVWHKFSQSVKSASKDKDTTLFKQFYGNRARVKIIFKYYPWNIILKNLHLILLSFLYWDYYFLSKGGLGKFIALKKNLIYYAIAGITQRKKYSKILNWTKYIKYQSFFELINWHYTSRQREKIRYNGAQ